MKITIHDCLVSVFGEKPSDSIIDKVLELLPKEIISIAEQWGPNDTEFRDKAYVWIKNNKHLF